LHSACKAAARSLARRAASCNREIHALGIYDDGVRVDWRGETGKRLGTHFAQRKG